MAATAAETKGSSNRFFVDFSRLGYNELEGELQQLETIYQESQTSLRNNTTASSNHQPQDINDPTPGEPRRQASGVLIQAESGGGKTCLLDQFIASIKLKLQQEDNNDSPLLVLRCKFEEGATTAIEPFATLQEAMEQLVQQLTANTHQDKQKEIWRQRCRQAVEKDADILQSVLPCLQPLLCQGRVESAKSTPGAENEPIVDETKDNAALPDASLHESVQSESTTSINFDSFGNMIHQEWRFERFRVAFRDFIRSIIAHHHQHQHHRIVWVADDLHWADADSLAILKTIVLDTHVHGKLFFVGATRPPEDMPTKRSGEKRLALHVFLDEVPRNILPTLRISRLSVEAISVWLERLLRDNNEHHQQQQQQQGADGEESELARLAAKIRQKSGGNPFVTVQLLRSLDEKAMFTYSAEKSSWEWDLLRITTETDHRLAQDPAHLVLDNLQTLDARTRSALVVAAVFGASRFTVATIVHAIPILENNNDPKNNQSGDKDAHMDYEEVDSSTVRRSMRDIQGPLQSAVEKGFLEELSVPGHFKFAHDRIRHAAYMLLPREEDRKSLHVRIGRQMRAWMDTEAEFGFSSGLSEESLLLHATKQLNFGADCIKDEWELLDLAELNFQAAELAAKRYSFRQSMECLEMGMKHLGRNPWERHYRLTYKLHVALSRIQYSSGCYEKSMETANKVIANGKVFKDKRVAYHTKILCLCQQRQYDEAYQVIMTVFDILGEPFPTRFLKVRMMVQYLKIDSAMRKLSDEDILSFGDKDEIISYQVSCEFIYRLYNISLWVSRKQDWANAAMGILRITSTMLERRKSPNLPLSVMSWSGIKMRYGDLEQGTRFGKLALAIARRTEHIHPEHSIRLELLYWALVHPWYRPPREGLIPIKIALDRLWKLGFLESVHVDYCQLLRLGFLCGEHLDDIAAECEKHSECLLDFQQRIQWSANLPLCQAVQNLRITTSNPARLSGDYMDEGVFLAELRKATSMNATTTIIQYEFFASILAYHFGDYDKALALFEHGVDDVSVGGGFFIVQARVLYKGLVYLAAARKNRQPKLIKIATDCKKQLQLWTERGSIASKYMYKLVLAESTGLKALRFATAAAVDIVIALFDDAIEEAKRLQMRHHVALGNELAAMYLLSSRAQKSKTNEYLQKAAAGYREWGAHAKVDDLQSRFGVLLKTPQALSTA